MDSTQFHASAQTFLELLFQDLAQARIQLPVYWDIDHLCYRAATEESYQKLKDDFSNLGLLLIESQVNGRLISTFKLNEPVYFLDWRIDLVELPAPKSGKVTEEGFEHIEIVCDVPFSELQQKFSHLDMDTKGLSKDYNQELEICLGKRNIKFHHSSLESVINLEKSEKIWQAIQDSKVLSLFREKRPLVAGTFPLGIATTLSDVDILIQETDLPKLRSFLEYQFSTETDFKITEDTVDELPTLICGFKFQGIPFELFAQDKETVKQTAYVHFQVEERLLKYGGEVLKARVQGERSLGIHTEHAFANLLSLPGDPYVSLAGLIHESGPSLVKLCGPYLVL